MDNNFNTRVFDVEIACIDEIGLNGAIILHQIQYWLDVTRQQAASNEEIRAKHFINGKWWIYNTYEQWQEQFPFWSTRTIKREFTKLKKAGVVIAGRYNLKGYDQTKWYTISENVLENLIKSHSAKLSQWKMPNCHDALGQNGTTNTIEYPKENSTEYGECKRDFLSDDKKTVLTASDKVINYKILKRQIQKICDEEHAGNQEYCFDVLRYYFERYKEHTGRDHPRINNANMRSIIDVLCNGTDIFEPNDSNEWKTLIDKYFDTSFQSCDYRINHFVSEEIINNRFYEELY